jgi:hypothetical protein
MIFAQRHGAIALCDQTIPVYVLSNGWHVMETHALAACMTAQTELDLSQYLLQPPFHRYFNREATDSVRFEEDFGSKKVIEGITVDTFLGIAGILLNVRADFEAKKIHLAKDQVATMDRWILIADTAEELGRARAEGKKTTYN